MNKVHIRWKDKKEIPHKEVITKYYELTTVTATAKFFNICSKTVRDILNENNIKRIKIELTDEHKNKCGLARKGKKFTPEQRKKRSIAIKKSWKPRKKEVTIHCTWCGKEIKRRPSEIKNTKHPRCNSDKCKILQKRYYSGDKSPHWQGGITDEMRKIYNSLEYKDWRKKVFERDNFECQTCGQIGGKLNAHHIKEVCIYPNKIFDVDNGLTLCEKCHKHTDNYGYKAIKRKRKMQVLRGEL